MSMIFPPLKPDRCLLWITLHPDDEAAERGDALEAALKTCRLHPLDMTACAEIVIVEEAALREKLHAVRAVLGPADRLHLVSAQGARLNVEVIATSGVDLSPGVAPDRLRPSWRQR